MIGRVAAVVAVVVSGCAELREYSRAQDRADERRSACLAGVAAACDEATAHFGIGRNGRPALDQQLIDRGCELGVARLCLSATARSDEEGAQLDLRACRLGEPEGCLRLLRNDDLDPRARDDVGAVLCECSARACVQVADDQVRDAPAFAAKLAARACELDAQTCADADSVVARSKLPDACHRAHGNWDDCAHAEPLDVVRRACAAGSDAACAELGERLTRPHG